MKLLPFLISCVYSGVKLFVFTIKSRRRYSIFVWFIYRLEEKNSKAEVMSSAVNLLLLLSSLTPGRVNPPTRVNFLLFPDPLSVTAH